MADGPSITNMKNDAGAPITRLRVSVDVGNPIPTKTTFMTNPSRMIVDFPGVKDLQVPRMPDFKHDLIKSYRGGRSSEYNSRLIIDTEKLPPGFDVKSIKTGFEKGADGNTYFNIDFPGAMTQPRAEQRSKPAQGFHMKA